MSNIPVSGGAPAPAGNEGVKMVFRVVQSLKAIASAYPETSRDVDDLISQLEQKVAKSIITGGSTGQAAPTQIPDPGGMGSPF